MYPYARGDYAEEPLDGSKHWYTLIFVKDQFPPVNTFWSVTMYTTVADPEPNRPVPDQFADAAEPEDEPRRFAEPIPAEKLVGQRQAAQLAAGTRWSHVRGDAAVLAERDAAVDPSARRGHMAAAWYRESELINHPRGTRPCRILRTVTPHVKAQYVLHLR